MWSSVVDPSKPPKQKQQQQVAELCGASIRALTGLRELRHRGRTLFLAGQRVHSGAPHSAPDPLRDGFRAHRGAADGIALRLIHSDAKATVYIRLTQDTDVNAILEGDYQ